MKLIIGADLIPTKANYSAFINGDITTIVGTELADLLKSADYRLFNLESPLTSKNNSISKNGPAHYTPVEAVTGYEKLGVDLLTLANNHILDQGQDGLKETINLLKDRHISFLGAGENIDSAQKPFYITVDGVKIGFFACVENEFSCATKDSFGANPYDPLISFDIVADMKNKCDKIIILFHGGRENYRYPSPQLQRVCRKFIDVGADLLICQHSHCIGCMEEYNGGRIIYGQGNFVFAENVYKGWKTGLLLQICDGFQLEFVPVVQTLHGTRLANNEEAKSILEDFYQRSEEIKSPDFIEKKYQEIAKRKAYYYSLILLGKENSIFVRVLNKLTGERFSRAMVNRISKRTLLKWDNYIKCESHRELLLAGLKELVDKKK